MNTKKLGLMLRGVRQDMDISQKKVAEEILADVHRHHDAEIGINWDSIEGQFPETLNKKGRRKIKETW